MYDFWWTIPFIFMLWTFGSFKYICQILKQMLSLNHKDESFEKVKKVSDQKIRNYVLY